ncbi:uncharacterized protein LOC114360187 [Ostrinia furnacalis]|uniref:uncharacterized protein LOC114360187 n=1 Tax=Ostrinia furnacalis TaxID=93504 RepID=UPI00103A64F1|nr:uncharacterized protein LOC114360187 [Ostrinia furnacalis]
MVLNIILVRFGVEPKQDSGDSDFGGNLISQLGNDENLDLSHDEEYEDLRAEFLAYHTALASIASDGRRSMLTTPCWKLGGICINNNLCTGFKFLTEVPGCKDKLKVCCFVWNKFNVRDHRHEGIGSLAMPWTLQQEFGGEGVVVVDKKAKSKKNKKKTLRSALRSTRNRNDNDFKRIAFIITV